MGVFLAIVCGLLTLMVIAAWVTAPLRSVEHLDLNFDVPPPVPYDPPELDRHDEIMRWLSPDVQKALRDALPPHLRGWYTTEETFNSDGDFVEVTRMGDAECRYLRVR